MSSLAMASWSAGLCRVVGKKTSLLFYRHREPLSIRGLFSLGELLLLGVICSTGGPLLEEAFTEENQSTRPMKELTFCT